MELKIEGVTREFGGFKAVDQVSCHMHNGVYGLLGVNGAGKTTLMRMLCTLLKPTAGRITCDGEDIFVMDKEYRKRLGYLPQEFGFYPDFTVQEYLMYVASIKGLRQVSAKKRVTELLQRVGLSKAAHKKMKKLSGGMKRRAGIAQAMLNDPDILILDEPTAGLDPNERIRFRNLLSGLSQDRLVLLSTHIVSDVEYIANEILLMGEGRIVLSGSPEKIMASVPDKVYSCRTSLREAQDWAKDYKVANRKTITGGVELRMLSREKPCPDARQEEITLEDVFLYYFGEKGGEDDGLL